MSLLSKFKKNTKEEEAAAVELKKTLISLKAIAMNLQMTAEEFSSQLNELKEINDAEAQAARVAAK